MTRKPSPALVALRLERLGWYLDDGVERRRAVEVIARAMRSRLPLRVLVRAWMGAVGDTPEQRRESAEDWRVATRPVRVRVLTMAWGTTIEKEDKR